MEAIEELKTEHTVIKRVLAVLDAHLQHDTLGPDDLREAIRFVRGFADACHHGKEEKSLFPLLSERSEAVGAGPVRVMLEEHEEGRDLIGRLAAALPGIEAGDAAAKESARQAISAYTRMLEAHIAKEEDVLFPLAEALLSEADADALARDFEAVEDSMGPDAHPMYHALVDALEEKAGTRA